MCVLYGLTFPTSEQWPPQEQCQLLPNWRQLAYGGALSCKHACMFNLSFFVLPLCCYLYSFTRAAAVHKFSKLLLLWLRTKSMVALFFSFLQLETSHLSDASARHDWRWRANSEAHYCKRPKGEYLVHAIGWNHCPWLVELKTLLLVLI